LLYAGDKNRPTYRTTESVLVVPGAQEYSSLSALAGPTRNYQEPSSPANGFFHDLSSVTPFDPWNGAYTGADEDNVQYDCHLWNDKGQASNSTMQGFSATWGNPVTQVNLYGSGSNPLESDMGAIKWNLVVSLDTTDPAQPKAWISGGTATCYPEHVVTVNGIQVFDQPPSSNLPPYIVYCLALPGSTVSPSQHKTVPPY
jgi:hypothetical protein